MADRPIEGFEQILRGQLEETGRPLNPTFKDVLSGWVDPTARAFFKPDGETITRRERTLVSVSSYYVAEGFMGALTPLAMLQWAIAMLTFLGLTDDELTHGFQGIDVDPWGELAELPAEAREEFGRALWHLGEGLSKAGLDG